MALFFAAGPVFGRAVSGNRRGMAAEGFPAFDLPLVILVPASEVVAAVPLEPAARIIRMDPALSTPDRKRLAGIYAEKIQLGVVPLRTEPGAFVPGGGKLFPAVCHIFSTKYAKFKHIPGGKLRLEIRMKVPVYRLGKLIAVTRLHFVVYDDDFLFHKH